MTTLLPKFDLVRSRATADLILRTRIANPGNAGSALFRKSTFDLKRLIVVNPLDRMILCDVFHPFAAQRTAVAADPGSQVKLLPEKGTIEAERSEGTRCSRGRVNGNEHALDSRIDGIWKPMFRRLLIH